MNCGRSVAVAAVVTIAVLTIAPFAAADICYLSSSGMCSSTPTSLYATADVTTGLNDSFTLTLTFFNTSGTDDASLTNWTLQVFNPGSIVTGSFSSLPAGWSFLDNSKAPNSGLSACNTQQSNSGWLCATDNGIAANAALIALGGNLQFVFNGTFSGTLANPFDLIAAGCMTAGTCTLDGGSNSTNKWAVSDPMHPPPIPEPASLVLFGTGLLGTVGFLRRKFRRS